jgi:hypothetical protein
MIADENVKKKDIAEIDVELRDETVFYIQKAILRNLTAIRQFLKIPGYEYICAGLYTYAVEEFGKILYLKSFSPPASKNRRPVGFSDRFSAIIHSVFLLVLVLVITSQFPFQCTYSFKYFVFVVLTGLKIKG